MTCIAGIAKDGNVWIGGDGATLEGDSCIRMDTRSKVFRVGEFLIGSTGTHRLCQSVEYLFEPPAITEDIHAYMVKGFVGELRKVVKAELVESEVAGELMVGRLLVGARGRLFEVDGGYGVFSPALPYHAIGCASQAAVSAMFKREGTPEEVLTIALEAAAEFDAYIRPPFTIASLK